MNYNKKNVTQVDVKGKKVLLRCDFNVPQDKATGAITDDKRIRAALPTIQYLLDNGAAVIACSHLGKPKGEWKESLTLAPVAVRLSELLGKPVILAADDLAPSETAQLDPKMILGFVTRGGSVNSHTAILAQASLLKCPRLDRMRSCRYTG